MDDVQPLPCSCSPSPARWCLRSTTAHGTVERLTTVAPVALLFDGRMYIGGKRFRASATPIVIVGVAGTLLPKADMLVTPPALPGPALA